MWIKASIKEPKPSDSFLQISGLKRNWRQDSVCVNTFLYDIAQQSRKKWGIACHVYHIVDPPKARIRIHGSTLAQGLLMVLGRLKKRTGAMDFYMTFKVKNRMVLLDIGWRGKPASSSIIRQWEAMPAGDDHLKRKICLAKILILHQSSLWAHGPRPNGTGMAHLSICIPKSGCLRNAPKSNRFGRTRSCLDNYRASFAQINLSCGSAVASIVSDIYQAGEIKTIAKICSRLPGLVRDILNSGSDAKEATGLISTVSDVVLEKFINFAMEAQGPAPTEFAFVCLGSEGRKEQTLNTDQDNAIIFSDPEDEESIASLQSYFLNLGKRVCSWLNQAGYNYCEGGIMAKNPKWCQPVSVWKNYFSSWIHDTSPQDLRHATIFFDLRFVHGQSYLSETLLNHLFSVLSVWPGFLRNMVKNAVYFSVPINIFGQVRVATRGPDKGCIDLKMAHLPIIDYARIYALKYGIKETATHNRLFQLYKAGGVSFKEYNSLLNAHEFITELRFKAQFNGLDGWEKRSSNTICLTQLSFMDRQKLKRVLKKFRSLQAMLQLEFIGNTTAQGIWF